MAGYNPASNSTSNLPQSRVIYYDKRFIENLKAQTPFVRCAERRELPLNSGNQLELFINKYVNIKSCYIRQSVLSWIVQ